MRDDTYMMSTLKGLNGEGGGGETYNLFFFITENWICAMTIHCNESNVNILTRNLLIHSGVRGCSHPIMI